jgi:hypothetical protein
MVLTFLVGILGILSGIGQPIHFYQAFLAIIYLALLSGVCFSIWRVFGIYRELRRIAFSDKELGAVIYEYARDRRTLFDKITDWSACKYFEVSIILSTIVIFSFLYLTKILGW